MSFIYRIIGYLNDLSDFFYDIYLEVWDWVWPFWRAAELFYEVCLLFSWLAWRFSDFAEWLEWAADEIGDILSWSNIRSQIGEWLDGIEDALAWWDRWWVFLGQEIEGWWDATQNIVKGWIEAAKNYLIVWWETELQELKDILDSTISYLTDWWNTEFQELRDIATAVNDFFTITLPTLASKLDVMDLINTAIEELLPFIEGWQEIKDSVLEFFADPLEWLWTRFANWFLGPEV